MQTKPKMENDEHAQAKVKRVACSSPNTQAYTPCDTEVRRGIENLGFLQPALRHIAMQYCLRHRIERHCCLRKEARKRACLGANFAAVQTVGIQSINWS